MRLDKSGFTLVEIIVVVGIIGLLAALAMPNFFNSISMAKKNICIANLRQIQNAVDMWAAAEDKSVGDAPPEMSDLVPNYIKRWPSCGTTSYDIPAIGEAPSCPQGISGHEL